MAKIAKVDKAKQATMGENTLKKSKPKKSVSAVKAKTMVEPKLMAKPKSKVKLVKVNIVSSAKAGPFDKLGTGVRPIEQAVVKGPVVSIPASFTPPFALGNEKKEAVGKMVDKKTIQSPLPPLVRRAKGESSAEVRMNVSPQSVGLYRKIAFSFIFLTAALLAVIFYFSFVKVTITLIPAQERITSNLVIDVYDKDKASAGEDAIAGVVTQKEIEESKIYLASGGEVTGEEAVGRVTIINNYSRSQPLVATTRLLSANNKLFRIKDTVNVPAGGSAEVDIYADAPSPEMAIGPTRFTIPGLWAGLQSQIYAESKEPIKYQKKMRSVISQTDIDAAVADLKQSLLARAKSEIDSSFADYDQRLYSLDENSISTTVDGKVGEEKEGFTVDVKTSVVLVAFKSEAIAGAAREKLALVVPDDKELTEFDAAGVAYTLGGYDLAQSTATVNAAVEGKMTLKADSGVVDKNILVGLSEQQLNDYLSGLPEIAGFDVKFSPSFINKVPNLVDRIEVEVKK